MYDSYENDESKQAMDSQEALAELINVSAFISNLKALTGRTEPDVIT